MISTSAVAAEPSKIRDRIIIALDVPTVAEARSVVGELSGAVGAFKVGMQLFTAAGPEFVRELTEAGHKVFLDLKFHDIPNTVASAGVAAAELGVWMFNVHASGGSEMMRQTSEVVATNCEKRSVQKPLMVGVTVLTSSDEDTLLETGVAAGVPTQVERLAKLAHAAGLDGVVASAREVAGIRRVVDTPGFITVTPGIRRENATSDDQRRVTTIGDALAGGSDYVVIGRPVLAAQDRLAAVEAMIEETQTN